MDVVEVLREIILYGFNIGFVTGFSLFMAVWIPSTIFKLIDRAV